MATSNESSDVDEPPRCRKIPEQHVKSAFWAAICRRPNSHNFSVLSDWNPSQQIEKAHRILRVCYGSCGWQT
jgi:hypothetical protein